MPNAETKLATIVFTDIVDFTRLSAENEPLALQLLATQRDTLKPIIERHNGSWLNEIGDGLLLSFNTTKDAVECCIEIQHTIKNVANLNLRIGIHQGEITAQDDDIIGDDVNIASRIQSYAQSGGIIITENINSTLLRNPVYQTKTIEKPELKGVSQNIQLYEITSHGLSSADTILNVVSDAHNEKTPPTMAKSSFVGIIISILITIFMIYKGIDYFTATKEVTGETSIAVINFDNVRKFQDYEWLGDEIAADLSYKLGGIPEVRVIDRFQILNKLGEVDPEKASILEYKINQIANTIDVDLILHGQFTILDSIVKVIAVYAETKTFSQTPIMNEKYSLNELSDIPTYINDKISDFINNDPRFKGNSK